MPSKIEHEILKLRGEVSATGRVYTDSIADIRDDLTDSETDIKNLQSSDDAQDNAINKVKTVASKALITAKTALPTERNRKFTVDSRRTTGGSGLTGDHLDKAATEYSRYNFKLPEDFISLVRINVICRRANACVSGEVCLELNLVGGEEGEAYDHHDYSDTIFPTIASAAHYNFLFDPDGMTVNKEDYITVTVQRVGGNGADTLDEDLILTMLEVEYLSDM